jgi:hypothetical protein
LFFLLFFSVFRETIVNILSFFWQNCLHISINGGNVMITIFGDFRQFTAKELAILCKTFVTEYFLHKLL